MNYPNLEAAKARQYKIDVTAERPCEHPPWSLHSCSSSSCSPAQSTSSFETRHRSLATNLDLQLKCDYRPAHRHMTPTTSDPNHPLPGHAHRHGWEHKRPTIVSPINPQASYLDQHYVEECLYNRPHTSVGAIGRSGDLGALFRHRDDNQGVGGDAAVASQALHCSSSDSSLHKLETINRIICIAEADAVHDHHANKAHGQPVTFDSSSKSIDDIELGEVERAQRLEKLKQRAALLVSDDSTDSLDISPTKWAQTSPRRKQRAHRIVATKADELEREELVRQRRQTLATSIALSVNSHTVVHPVVAADATATAAAAMPLGEVFRRVSLAHEKHRPPDTTTRVLDTTHQLLAAARFGVYRAHEVMAVIRFFWYLDEDRSGTISLPELHSIKLALVAAGYDDMAAVFLAIDHDSNGSISLRELLELCFHRATKTQIKEMLTLAKLGDLPAYLTHLGYHSPKQPRPREDPEEAEHRKEMMEIFRVFDTDNDGTVSVDEIMETLRVDDDDVVAKFMATERETRKRSLSVEAWKSATSGIKRDDIEKFYAECDLDHNRLLNFDEFVEFLGAYYRPLLPMIMGVPDKHSPPKSGYTASTTHTKLKETQNLVTANLFI